MYADAILSQNDPMINGLSGSFPEGEKESECGDGESVGEIQ